LSIVLNHPRALPQGDDRAWPAFACRLIRRHRQLSILDARQVLNDVLAIDSPHVDAVQKVSSVHALSSFLLQSSSASRKSFVESCNSRCKQAGDDSGNQEIDNRMGGLLNGANFPRIADEHSREHAERESENQKGF
jgi:hypothetical protein